MLQEDEVRSWINRTVLDKSGHKIGMVSRIFIDDATSQPEWATVKTGLFDRGSSFIPIEGMRLDGQDLHVPWDREQVKDAPLVDENDAGHLTPEEEVQLYRHYARQQLSAGDADVDGDGHEEPVGGGGERQVDGGAARDRGLDTMQVKSGSSEPGQTRLRKYVVTEEVHPVSRVLLDDSAADDDSDLSAER
jgi:hypothetical protein